MPTNLPVMDEARFRENFAGLEHLLPGLVQSFLAQSPGMLLRVRTALARGDAAEVKSAAHAFKGVLLQMFASRGAALAAELERRGAAGQLEGAAALSEELGRELARYTSAVETLSLARAA